jgi:hypothetical protein
LRVFYCSRLSLRTAFINKSININLASRRNFCPSETILDTKKPIPIAVVLRDRLGRCAEGLCVLDPFFGGSNQAFPSDLRKIGPDP